MDDDTYYDMDLFVKKFQAMDSSIDIFYAGCLVRWPVHEVNFTFPYGGFGSIFSRESLRKLFLPISCADNNNAENNDNQAMCDRIAENNVGEEQYFTNNMNLVELMYRYSSTEKYRDVARWKSGFCMHSDWVIGYFINYYNVSKHVVNPFYTDVPHARLEAYKGSEIYRKGTGFCMNEVNCKEGDDICHRVSLEWMMKKTKRWKG